jgi:hypothetical protein
MMVVFCGLCRDELSPQDSQTWLFWTRSNEGSEERSLILCWDCVGAVAEVIVAGGGEAGQTYAARCGDKEVFGRKNEGRA